jgi:hypothetical protein
MHSQILDPELRSHLRRRAQEIISSYDPAALSQALREHQLAQRILDELRFLGYLSAGELQAVEQYLRSEEPALEREASRRLTKTPARSRRAKSSLNPQ